MKEKILFVLPGFTFGGTVFSTLNMISLLSKEKYDVYVLPMTYQGPVRKYYADIKLLPESLVLSALMGRTCVEKRVSRRIAFLVVKTIRRIAACVGYDFSMRVFKMKAKSLQEKYAFNYVASCQEGGATYFVSCFPSTKRIAWFRSEYSVYKDLMTPKDLLKDITLYHRFDNIVCVSQTTRDDFCKYLFDIQERVLAIHNIQNVDNILSKSRQQIDDPFEKNTFNIVSVGRVAPQKRFPSIPRIAADLKRRGLKFKWYIIGDGNMQGEWEKLQSAMDEYDVRDVVVCMGSRLNPYPYIASANLSVTPSSYEACPRVVIEAKILKTPCVCADFSSAKEFVTNDHDGYVDTLDGIVEPIARMISDKNTYMRIKSACDSFKMDNDSIYKKLENVFSMYKS